MSTEFQYVDVVLPLPLPKLLTYSLEGVVNPVEFGMRVVVQVGAKKRYTAVVWRLHRDAPSGYAARPIESVVDEYPVVVELQRAFWEWMAGYYMCSRGEVMAAALPAGLKLSSQTRLVLHPDRDPQVERGISELDAASGLLFEAVLAHGGLTVQDAAKLLQVQSPQRAINRLVDAGLVLTEEELKERYRPKMERVVALAPNYCEESAVQGLLDLLEKRAPKQAEALLAYLGAAPTWGALIAEKPLLQRLGAGTEVMRKLEERGVLHRSKRPEFASAEVKPGQSQSLPILSPVQKTAYQSLVSSRDSGRMALLHGITGSGKTELYIHLIADALEAGGQVLFLVPEIALTTQLIQRLELHFGAYMSVYHSRFTTRERTETWLDVLGAPMHKKRNARGGRLIVGPRSAIFLPFTKLQLVLVDEEHEGSFKQQDPAPRYQARDAAMWLAQKAGAFAVLGSATPSVETHWLAEQGKLDRVNLTERFGGAQLPEIWCADLRKAHRQRAMFGHFTRTLKLEIEETLKLRKQIILFQNRRGYAPMWQCATCAWMPGCERCDVPLTHHKWKNELHCHHCGYMEVPPPKTCVSCGKMTMEPKGLGTERIEEELKEHFPQARVARMDWDTTRSKHGHERLVRAFANQEFDILVGTQMVTKGLDFAHVRLVGVLNADRMLSFPDFRSFERSYQMLTQVAGRAGRAGERGKVILQTFNPEHWVLNKVMEHDYHGLVKQELLERKNYKYPPFDRLIRITLRHSDANRLDAAAEVLAYRLRQRFAERAIGPETPVLSRINDLHHRIILLKFERSLPPASYKTLLGEDVVSFQSDERFKRIRITVDVDPV
jgi:primosomal protein N' (replication factor Y) (superfamily II helicase)